MFFENLSTYVEVTTKVHVILDFPSYMHFFLPALGKDSGVRNLLNTRPELEGVEKAAVF